MLDRRQAKHNRNSIGNSQKTFWDAVGDVGRLTDEEILDTIRLSYLYVLRAVLFFCGLFLCLINNL